MLDKLYDAFRKDPERMIFKFWVIFIIIAGVGFCSLMAATISLLK